MLCNSSVPAAVRQDLPAAVRQDFEGAVSGPQWATSSLAASQMHLKAVSEQPGAPHSFESVCPR